MRHHWLEDRIKDNTIQFIWRPGKLNRADYFTKHHAPSHHRKMRAEYLVKLSNGTRESSLMNIIQHKV